MLHISALKPQLNTQYAAAYKKTNNKEIFSYQLKTKIIPEVFNEVLRKLKKK